MERAGDERSRGCGTARIAVREWETTEYNGASVASDMHGKAAR
jgi:hypothetical protein